MMPDASPFGPKTAGDGGQVEPSGIEPVTCLVCGCLCDDISVVKQGEKITAAGNACVLGTEWLLRDRVHEPGKPAALVKGQPVEAAEAVELAARLLMNAHAPIILGLGRSTNETVAAALELADRIGAVVEPGNSRSSAPRMLAFQRVGRVSATLGEVKNRADVVVFWGADPVVSHPRHWERYSVEPRGRFIPQGRAGRTVIVVDQERTATAEQADLFVEIDKSRQFEVLWVLRALVRGAALDAIRVREIGGADLPRLRELGERLMAARYGAFFHGPLIAQGTMTEASATLEAAYGLVRDLNRQARFVILGMGEPGNSQGAEAVLTWQTAFHTSVDLSAGYPRSLPGVTTASRRFGCGEADLALIVGSLPLEQLDENSREHLEKIPAVVIAPRDDTAPWPAEPGVRCFAATPGLDDSGTVMRIDGVSLPLRPVRASPFLTERQWLEAIVKQMTSLAST
jgi:formylmethanofuran dehydrogenase subunit B